jgi:alpha-methylacyl-CoA racemase
MGPLDGVRVVEMAGLGPAPFGSMVLADLGADVVLVDRPKGEQLPARNPLGRGKARVVLDVKNPPDLDSLRALVAVADVFVEPWRAGVAERLDLGPDALLELNPRLVYTRVTGWGQVGPLAPRAGHDINFIGLAGALDMIGRPDQAPVPPAALLGDMAGGGMLMALGVTAALLDRERSGAGQVVDAAIVDGAALLTTAFHGLRDQGLWPGGRGENLIDGGAFYDTYETADGRYVAVGPLEPQFFAVLVSLLHLETAELPPYTDPAGWQRWKSVLAAKFRERTRDKWTELFAETDACVTPVLSPWQAHEHPHNIAREVFIEVDGLRQPAPAPRFSRTSTGRPAPMRDYGTDVRALLAAWTD